MNTITAPKLEQRIIYRLPCSFELQLTGDGRNTGTVQALNISLIGLGFSHNLDGLEEGEEVALGMAGQKDVRGTVRWSDSQYAGVQFSHCLDHVWDSWVMKAMPAGPKPKLGARLSNN